MTRDIYSNAQLQEVMTDFWLNHFNVYLHKNEATPYYLVSYERDVIEYDHLIRHIFQPRVLDCCMQLGRPRATQLSLHWAIRFPCSQSPY